MPMNIAIIYIYIYIYSMLHIIAVSVCEGKFFATLVYEEGKFTQYGC